MPVRAEQPAQVVARGEWRAVGAFGLVERAPAPIEAASRTASSCGACGAQLAASDESARRRVRWWTDDRDVGDREVGRVGDPIATPRRQLRDRGGLRHQIAVPLLVLGELVRGGGAPTRLLDEVALERGDRAIDVVDRCADLVARAAGDGVFEPRRLQVERSRIDAEHVDLAAAPLDRGAHGEDAAGDAGAGDRVARQRRVQPVARVRPRACTPR